MPIHDEREVLHGPAIFRYTGTFDWKRMYRESRDFWHHRIKADFDFEETLYKHKPSKIQAKWEIKHYYDAYFMIHYKIEFKCPEARTVYIDQPDGTKKEMVEGPLVVWIHFGWKENYKKDAPAGKSNMFDSTWLEAIYRKFTWRERWDLIDDIALFTTNDFVELLKKVTDSYAKGYSIWEGQ